MKEQIVGAVVGAIITGLFSVLIFHLGNFSTQESIVESLSVRFDSVDESMSYEQALQAIYQERESDKNEIESLNKQIDDLNLTINDLNAEIDKKQLEISNQESQEEINKIIQNATDYWNNSDYIQSLTLLKNSKTKSEDIKSLYEKYSNEYILNLLSQADLLISERKYDEAIKLLNDGKAVVDNDKMIGDKIIDINNNQPTKLSNLKISASRFFYQEQDKPVIDTVNNRYSSGNAFITYAEGDSNYGYATFYLGKKYTSINGLIAVSDESENRSDVQLKGWIEIGTKSDNGEEFNLLWSSPELSRTTSTIEIPELEINDSEWLEIRYHNSGDYFSLAGGYHSLRVIIADIMAYND